MTPISRPGHTALSRRFVEIDVRITRWLALLARTLLRRRNAA